MEEKNNFNNSEEIKNNQDKTEYNENLVKKKEKLNIGKLSIIILILIAVLGTLYAVSCYQVNKAKKEDNTSIKTVTSVSSTVPSTVSSTAEVKRTGYTTATLPRANKQNNSNKKVLKVKTSPMVVRSTYRKDSSNKTNCINNSKSVNNSSVNRINPITNLNNPNSNSKITINKLSTKKSKKKKIDFSNKHINRKKMNNLLENDKKIAYITCKSIGLKHYPIYSHNNVEDKNHNYVKNIGVNSHSIILWNYDGKAFGQGYEIYICGHNYNALKNLKNAKKHDRIIIEMNYGANYEYEITTVTKAYAVEKNTINGRIFNGFKSLKKKVRVGYYRKKGNAINLFTCVGSSNTQKYYVRARRIAGNPIK